MPPGLVAIGFALGALGPAIQLYAGWRRVAALHLRDRETDRAGELGG